MLGIMRKYKESIVIKIVFVIIVLSFIGTIFLVWGRGDNVMTPSTFAVKVDGTSVPYEVFAKQYDAHRSIYQQIYGAAFTPDMEKQLKIKETVIDTLVKRELAAKEAKSLNVTVTKDELVAAIAAEQAFQKDGAFNFDLYQQVLRQNRMTTKDFEAAKKKELLVAKVSKTIKDRVKVTDEQALQEYKKQNDKVNIEYVAFTPASVKGEVKVTEQEINDYYQKNSNAFKTTEQIAVAYALIDPAKAAGTVTVTDDEAQKFYQKNIDKYQEKNEILPYEKVKDKVRGDALKEKAARTAYEKVAQALNQQAKTADLKAAAAIFGATVNTTPLFSATQPPPALATEAELVKKAFMLKDGELGPPVETAKGIYLIKLAQRKPSAVPPLTEVKAQVEAKAAEEKAQALAKKKAEEAVAAFNAKSAVTGLKETGLFKYAATGLVPTIGASPELMDAAVALTTAAPVAKAPFKVGGAWYAVRLKARIDAPQDEFQRTKEQLKATLLPKMQEENLDKWLTELKTKAKIEINPALQNL